MIAPSIPRQLSGETIEDFAALKGEALNWLAQWCAAGEGESGKMEWSDFNVHDPGVQIVEVICYALTELAYRARLPLLTILQNRNGVIEWEDGAFFAPPNILPMSPLTAADYRKLLLDRFPELYQVWLTPGLNGHHTIWLYFHPLPSAEHEGVMNRARELLEHHRNLGERFTVSVAPEITLTGEFALGHEVHHPSTLEEALYRAAQQAITEQPAFTSIADRQKAGHSLSDIFTGPLLKHGSILCDSLNPLLTWEQTQKRLLAALSKFPGVAVTNIRFGCTASSAYGQGPPPPSLGGLSGPLRLDFSQAPVELHTASEWVSNLRTLDFSSRPPSTNLLRPRGWTMPKPDPAWQYKSVSGFHPLHQSFPPNYGLGPDELPPSATPLRRAQIQQLRGYLLHFEQLMRNYLAQLTHLPALFSTQPQKQTYFTQTLYGVPEIMPLLKGFNDDELKLTRPSAIARADDYRRNLANPYRRQLDELNEKPGEFSRRRHRFLDHLLARFGESFSAPEGATYETIHNKESLLRRLPELGYRRATAGPTEGHRLRESGLEEKITLLLQRDWHGSDELEHEKFYYVIENSLLSPHEAESFVLTHVLVNWTASPLSPAFRHYVESLICEYSGAHLLNEFLWFETEPADFVNLYQTWQSSQDKAGAAALLLAWMKEQAKAAAGNV